MTNHACRWVIATLLLVGAWSSTLTVAEEPTATQRPQTARSPSQVSLPLGIGGASFRVGMSRSEAMALIRDCCRTSAVSDDGMFLNDKSTNEIIGSISFNDGRVSRLSRHEKQSQNREASDFVLALYRSVLERNTAVQSANLTLSAFPEELANATKRHLLLKFSNGRKLRVSQTSIDDGSVVVDLEEER
jgi:hypothetical protein